MKKKLITIVLIMLFSLTGLFACADNKLLKFEGFKDISISIFEKEVNLNVVIVYNDFISVNDGFLAVGYVPDGRWFSPEPVLTKFDKQGNKIFEKYFTAKSNRYDRIDLAFNTVIEISDGYIVGAKFIAGNKNEYGEKEINAIIKYDVQGNLIWAKEPGLKPMIANESGFLVFGREDRDKKYDYNNMFMAQFDTDGNIVEKKIIEYNFEVGGWSYAFGAVKAFNYADGYFILAETTASKIVIAFYSIDGVFRWQREMPQVNNIDKISISEDGIIAISENSFFYDGKSGCISSIIKFDFEMNQIWAIPLDNYPYISGNSNNFYFHKVIQSNENIFIFGYYADNGDLKNISDFYGTVIVGINQNGEVFWESGLQPRGYYHHIIVTDTGFAIYEILGPRRALLFYDSTSLTYVEKTI